MIEYRVQKGEVEVVAYRAAPLAARKEIMILLDIAKNLLGLFLEH